MKRKVLIKTLRSWWTIASAIVLMTIAALGILYDALHKFGNHELARKLVLPEEALILLVAVVCGGLGAERLLTLRKIEADIETAQEQRSIILKKTGQISNDVDALLTGTAKLRSDIVDDFKAILEGEKDIITGLKRIAKTEALIGTRQIESAAIKLIDECDDNSEKIKATGQYRGRDGLSHAYFQHVADRVARAKRQGGSMEYHVVVASTQPGEFRDDDARVSAFKNGHIEDRLNMRTVKQSWPFEVLIGGQSMIIALLGGETKSKYEAAVKITDPDFVKKAADWFREVLWAGADKI